MRPKLKEAFNAELDKSISLYEKNELDTAFYHLERAHILGQSYIIPHTRTHWWMLKVGWKKGNPREVFGQMSRIIASIIFSKVWVPKGNTGGANVNPFKAMPIPEGLEKILNEDA